jgi:class 3 adenylate cyclase
MTRTGQDGLRRRLLVTLIGVALVSVVLISAVIYLFAQILIDDGVEGQLVSVRDTRVQALEAGLEGVQSHTSALAANRDVVDALTDLSREYGQLDDDPSPDEMAELTMIYETEVLPPFVAAGVDLPTADLVPASAAGRYVQQRYIAGNPNGFDDRDQLDDAGDGSGYSAAHAQHHPLLRTLLGTTAMSDLLLVDADTGDVVYTTKKRIDLGTNGFDGPYSTNLNGAKAGLGRVLDRLSTVAVGDAVVSDSVFYVPTAGEPVFFLAAAVRSGSDVIGAVVTELPASVLTAFMTAGQDWELLGLGDTGEAYIVGPDRTVPFDGGGELRSDSRLWLEDPDEYLRLYVERYGDQAAADLIETVGSPVLLQQVDNPAVTAALAGEEFIGTVTNYLGKDTLAVSAPVRAGGLDWAVIVEFDKSESDAELASLLRRILVVLAILLPAIAVTGVLLARVLTRPTDSLVQSAAAIADGDLDADVEDFGRNELGDLGRQLQGVAGQIELRDQAIVDEENHINDLLTAVLPTRLVDRVRRGEQVIEDIFDTATAVSITVDDVPEAAGVDQDIALEITERLNEAAEILMERYGVERIRRSSGSELYLCGLNEDDAQVASATEFVLAAIALVGEVGAEFGKTLTARAGMSAGDVATGVLGTSQLSFGVWGDPPGMAVTLASFAQPGQVLADSSVVAQLGPQWEVGPVEQLPGLADDIEVREIEGAVSEGIEPDRDLAGS